MPDNPNNAKIELETLDALTGRSPRKFFSLSPNDVLVQISLPLVLILAIATRLMIIGQSMAALDKGPVIMELWKQQLILRIDRATDDWETESGIKAFPDFQRVFWENRRPNDPTFQILCTKAQELADIGELSGKLYRHALSYRPEDSENEAVLSGLFDIYDPQLEDVSAAKQNVPEEFMIDDERRDFALKYIQERCRKWKEHVEYLQWSALDRIAAEMKPDDPLMDSSLDAQMEKVASEMSKLGYPLLPGIAAEYQKMEIAR